MFSSKIKKGMALTLLGATLLAGISARAAIVANWSGDGTTVDSSNGNSGTLVNGASYGTGKWGQAFYFDGINDGMTVENSASLATVHTTNAITVCAWVKWSGTQNQYNTQPIVRKSTPTNANPYRTFELALQNSGVVDFVISDGTYGHAAAATSPTGLVAGHWYHLAGTYDGQTIKLYINGVLVDSTASTYVIGDTSGGLYVGRDLGAGSFFGGWVDQLEIYNNVLTQQEVQGRRDFNLPPVANAGPDQIVYVGSGTQSAVTVDGSASYDPEGHALTYTWTGDIVAQSASTSVSLANGIHMATLTVADEYGQASSATVLIAVAQGVGLSGYQQMQTLIESLNAQAAEDQATIAALSQKNASLVGLLQSLLVGLDQIQSAAATINSVSGQQKTAINAALESN